MESFAWIKAIKQPAKEFKLTKLQVIEGSIPKGISGALYRNGPARFERSGKTYKHWFDGDGAILGVFFNEDGASAMYKYVETEWLKVEEKAGEFLYDGFGSKITGCLSKLIRRRAKNASNTSVLPLPDRLLTLWEGGWPHSLNLKTLECKGIDNLGFLENYWTYSAHPKVDPDNGDIYNLGAQNSFNTLLNVYRLDKNGKLIVRGFDKYDGPNMVHDCVLAGKYMIFMNFATECKLLSLLTKSFHDTLQWKPERGTDIFVFDKETLKLIKRWNYKEAFYSFHYVNGYEESDGTVRIEFVKYKDFPNVDGFVTHYPRAKDDPNLLKGTGFFGKLATMRLDVNKGEVLEFKELDDTYCEFPTVADPLVGKHWRYTLAACHTKDYDPIGQVFKAIGRYDRKESKFTSYYFGENRYVNEPILVSDENDPENGYVLTLVYDSKENQGEIWIHRSEEIDKGPICRLLLPEVVPFQFHGRWQSKSF